MREVTIIMRCMLLAILIAGLLFSLGCSSVTTPDRTPDQFFGDQSPVLTGFVGDYSFTGNDGTIETGKLLADGTGKITLVPDRAASVFSNWWFDIDVEYLNPRGYTGMGLPYYYLGDTMQYKVKVDYKRGFNLDQYPLVYSILTATQRYYPSMAVLPGASTEVWDPLGLPPYAYVELLDGYYIPPATIPGNDCTTVNIKLEFLFGWCEFTLACGVAGLWDP
jgi:hypothetical protein